MLLIDYIELGPDSEASSYRSFKAVNHDNSMFYDTMQCMQLWEIFWVSFF